MTRALLLAALVVSWAAPAHAQSQPGGGAAETIEYYGTDHLGSVRVVFDAAGNVKARADYLPFGEEVFAPTGPMPPEQFTGQARDGEAGQDYFHARMYQPRTGRFNAVDPVYAGLFDPQQWNRYTYARNSPTTLTDPTGLNPEYYGYPSYWIDFFWGELFGRCWGRACNGSAGGGSVGGGGGRPTGGEDDDEDPNDEDPDDEGPGPTTPVPPAPPPPPAPPAPAQATLASVFQQCASGVVDRAVDNYNATSRAAGELRASVEQLPFATLSAAVGAALAIGGRVERGLGLEAPLDFVKRHVGSRTLPAVSAPLLARLGGNYVLSTVSAGFVAGGLVMPAAKGGAAVGTVLGVGMEMTGSHLLPSGVHPCVAQ